jgi:hypothetical protein
MEIDFTLLSDLIRIIFEPGMTGTCGGKGVIASFVMYLVPGMFGIAREGMSRRCDINIST